MWVKVGSLKYMDAKYVPNQNYRSSSIPFYSNQIFHLAHVKPVRNERELRDQSKLMNFADELLKIGRFLQLSSLPVSREKHE